MTYDEQQIGATLTYCMGCHRHYFCTVPRGSVCGRCWQAQRSLSDASAEILSVPEGKAHASAGERS